MYLGGTAARATLCFGSGEHAMPIRARGKHRFGQTVVPNDMTLKRKGDPRFASETRRVHDVASARARRGDSHRGGADFCCWRYPAWVAIYCAAAACSSTLTAH